LDLTYLIRRTSHWALSEQCDSAHSFHSNFGAAASQRGERRGFLGAALVNNWSLSDSIGMVRPAAERTRSSAQVRRSRRRQGQELIWGRRNGRPTEGGPI